MPYEELTGTKLRIFEKAAELFAQKNYETVTMRDIGESVGIKKPSVYAHFSGKQEILDTLYDFFWEHFLVDRPKMEDVEEVIKNGSISDIIDTFYYAFQGEYQTLMINITKIIENRKYVDERAKEIASSLMMDAGIKFVEDVLNRAIEMGRIAPMDTRPMGVFFAYIRFCLLQNFLLFPDKQEDLHKDEKSIVKYAEAQIIDLKQAD